MIPELGNFALVLALLRLPFIHPSAFSYGRLSTDNLSEGPLFMVYLETSQAVSVRTSRAP